MMNTECELREVDSKIELCDITFIELATDTLPSASLSSDNFPKYPLLAGFSNCSRTKPAGNQCAHLNNPALYLPPNIVTQ